LFFRFRKLFCLNYYNLKFYYEKRFLELNVKYVGSLSKHLTSFDTKRTTRS